MPGFRCYLAIQTVLPEPYRDDRGFIEGLSALQQAGFDGIELNIRDPRALDPSRLAAFFGGFGLSFSMFATGLAARSQGLSLATTEEADRRKSVSWTREALSFAADAGGGGVIVGYLKGAMHESSPAHREQLRTSLSELAPEAMRLKTPLLVEAINRFESPLGNSLADVMELIGQSSNPYLQILPDTWHMSIEEEYIESSLVRYRDQFSSVHLSDNNRFFPGYGGLDFGRIISVLDSTGYKGRLAIEGNVKTTFAEDARRSADYLRAFLRTD
jgi:sugar phosphate isomerase/epimerase